MPLANPEPEPGCYVDSHWGQYAIARAIEVAVSFGWEDEEAQSLADRHLQAFGPEGGPPLVGDEFERLVDAADDAESWLNENHLRDGYSWGWYDGDFGLYELEEA